MKSLGLSPGAIQLSLVVPSSPSRAVLYGILLEGDEGGETDL